MTARIFKPAKTAMQSGSGRTKDWVLEHEPASDREIDPLMGWTSSRDTQAQVKLQLRHERRGDRLRRADGPRLHACSSRRPRRAVKKSYAENFKFGRIGSWTH